MVYLADLRWPELNNHFKHDPLALIPIGSTEQHGPHAPLGTDHYIAEELAKEAAKNTGAICCPTIAVGVSSHHRHFPGTLYVPERVFEDYVLHVCLSLNFHGVNKILFVNGHGGNSAALASVAVRLKEQHKILIMNWEWWRDSSTLNSVFPGGSVAHADGIETSMINSFKPDLVKPELLPSQEKVPRKWGRKLKGTSIPSDTADFSSETGVAGEVTNFSVEKGIKLRKACIEHLEELIIALRNFQGF